jgi:benzoylformate decarboxylase
MPAAVGVALAVSSTRKVIGLFGDGSSMYSIQALWSAADLKLPLTIVIVNNRGYAALAEFSSHFNIKQLVGTKLPGIDFVGLARSMGCEAVRVERPQDLGQTLTAALQSPVPYLVDVAVE